MISARPRANKVHSLETEGRERGLLSAGNLGEIFRESFV